MSLMPLSISPPPDAFVGWIEIAIRAIEGLAAASIALSVLVFSLRFAYYMLVRRGRSVETFTQYKHGLGKALLLALERRWLLTWCGRSSWRSRCPTWLRSGCWCWCTPS
jgi:hypothetical protein